MGDYVLPNCLLENLVKVKFDSGIDWKNKWVKTIQFLSFSPCSLSCGTITNNRFIFEDIDRVRETGTDLDGRLQQLQTTQGPGICVPQTISGA